MSAAAAGASCRNARKRQALQITKDKAAAEKALKDKLEAEKAAELAAPLRSKQFHQLPPNYIHNLRAPHQPHGRKLSAGYTGHTHSSKLLLPIHEQSGQRHSPSQSKLHHSRHNLLQSNEPRNRDYAEHRRLSKSATAPFPLITHAGTPPPSPYCPQHQHQFFKEGGQNNLLTAQHARALVPNEGIIITPATPLPSPSPSNQRHQHNQEQPIAREDRLPCSDDMSEFPLERACSVYRNRQLDANDPMTLNIAELDDEYQQQFYPGGMPNGSGGHHTHWADDFCDPEFAMGVCTCDHAEVNFMSFVTLDVCFRESNFALYQNN